MLRLTMNDEQLVEHETRHMLSGECWSKHISRRVFANLVKVVEPIVHHFNHQSSSVESGRQLPIVMCKQ